VIDVDFQSAFPSLEWDCIREAVEECLPDVAPWTRWSHAEPGRVLLPSGEALRVDRGAEQGDLLGPLYCALTLARAQGIHFFDA